MQPGNELNSFEGLDDSHALQTTLFPLPQSHPLPIREFLPSDQPRHRLAQHGASALSDAELLAVITGVPCLETAQRGLSIGWCNWFTISNYVGNRPSKRIAN